jgi:hypothetical protein
VKFIRLVALSATLTCLSWGELAQGKPAAMELRGSKSETKFLMFAGYKKTGTRGLYQADPLRHAPR